MEELKQRIQSFAECFGLLGLMTALPTTPEFITYDAVYFPKNHFIKQGTLSTEDYLALFFPFDKISSIKRRRKHCGKIFVASRSSVQFCSPQCKNHYNVYKRRAKKDEE